MTQLFPWTRRSFRFPPHPELHPDLIGRLEGAIPRARAAVANVEPSLLTRRFDDSWSIQENIAHITDLEALFSGRLDDFDAGRPVLRAADMTNRVTNDSNHNARAIDEVLDRFQTERRRIIERLDGMAAADFARASSHPRLDQPMRVIDLLFFHAEHDDYHLARVREIVWQMRTR